MLTILELKKKAKQMLPDKPTVKLALLGDTATQLLATGIQGMGIERGYNIDLLEAEYNQVERQFMIPPAICTSSMQILLWYFKALTNLENITAHYPQNSRQILQKNAYSLLLESVQTQHWQAKRLSTSTILR